MPPKLRHEPRPKDWYPLEVEDRYSDPTPGDLEQVTSGQKSMKATATEIKDQIDRLRIIGEGEGLKGEYAQELQDGADKLRGKLEKTKGRYEKVSAELENWSRHLQHAQSETAAALTSAKDAAETIKSLVGSLDEESEQASKAEEELNAQKKEQLREARAKLTSAQTRYKEAIRVYDEEAKKIAGNVRDAIDDAVEDGFWSWLSNFIERNIKTIKAALEVLGTIATVLAMAALVIMVFAGAAFMPAILVALAPVFLSIGTAVTAITTASHVLMALTGNGGWGDVALDVLSLATMRVGSVAVKGVKAGVTAAQKASVKAGRSATKTNRANAADKLKRYDDAYNAAKSKKQKDAILKQKRAFEKTLKGKGATQQMPTPSRKEILAAGGDAELAAAQKYARNEAAKRTGDEATGAAADEVAKHGRRNLVAFGVGTGVDLNDKIIGSSDFIMPDKPSIEPYNDFKDWNLSQTGWYDYAP